MSILVRGDGIVVFKPNSSELLIAECRAALAQHFGRLLSKAVRLNRRGVLFEKRRDHGLDVMEVGMARPITHKFAIQTRGLSHEQAALLYYLLTSTTEAVLKGDGSAYDSASNVRLKVLRAEYPESDWTPVTTKQRVSLID